MRRGAILATLIAGLYAGVAAAAPVQILVGAITSAPDPLCLDVEIVAVNGSGTTFVMPGRLPARLNDGTSERPVVLERIGTALLEPIACGPVGSPARRIV